jgi:pimeloyl-ACP methyl ester carboxylesterase
VLGLDEAGDGALVLLLPALSSISTRGEMRPLMERLASQFRVVAIDWPGFGTRPRPNVRWTPDALSTFLEHVLEQVVGRPHGIVAAGHAASYVLDCASRRSGITDRLVLLLQHGAGPYQQSQAATVRSLPKYGVRSRCRASVGCSIALM